MPLPCVFLFLSCAAAPYDRRTRRTSAIGFNTIVVRRAGFGQSLLPKASELSQNVANGLQSPRPSTDKRPTAKWSPCGSTTLLQAERKHPMAKRTPAKAAPDALSDPPGSSDGMPPKTPTPGRARPGRAPSPADASDEASLAMPHERDQSTDMTSAVPDPQIQQADADLRRGLQDTDKSPAMDAAYDKLRRD